MLCLLSNPSSSRLWACCSWSHKPIPNGRKGLGGTFPSGLELLCLASAALSTSSSWQQVIKHFVTPGGHCGNPWTPRTWEVTVLLQCPCCKQSRENLLEGFNHQVWSCSSNLPCPGSSGSGLLLLPLHTTHLLLFLAPPLWFFLFYQ